jgi:hypothetical protein
MYLRSGREVSESVVVGRKPKPNMDFADNTNLLEGARMRARSIQMGCINQDLSVLHRFVQWQATGQKYARDIKRFLNSKDK